MESQHDWPKIIRRMEQLMRLKSFPVAFKMLEEEKKLDDIAYLRKPNRKVTLCQLISLVRNFDWTVGAKLDDFLFPACPSILGLSDIPETHKDGTFRNIVWVAKKEDAVKYEAAIPRIPVGKYQAVAMAPLVYNPFEPDIVLIYANPAQMMLLINALQFEDYEVMQFFCVGESSCSDAIARCYNTGKPSLTIPCYGERRYGHAQDEDLVMAIPADQMIKALRGLEALYRKGVRYPISYAGVEADPTELFPPAYHQFDSLMERLRGNDHRLLLGVTGSIACGKTTVTNILEELGAPLIDFDIIAREVVEPGTQGHKQIVEYFGAQVLQEDGNIDRKKLSRIVFGDMEKRKKLESFTHPPIYEAFIRQVNEIADRKESPIIQVAVPLLIELSLQYMFDKIAVVYIPTETQIERLIKRENIGKEEAESQLRSQLPPDDKLMYADYVINNEGTVEETRRQVEQMWESLKKIQKDKAV